MTKKITLFTALVFQCLLFFGKTYSVTSTADAGVNSLRQAMLDAVNGDTVFVSTTDTIRITSGPISVTTSIVITGGTGKPTKVISGESTSKLFVFNTTGINAKVSNLCLVNSIGTRGAAIYALLGTLVVDSCHFENNTANSLSVGFDGGGAIRLYTEIDATITNCSFVSNESIHTYLSTSSVSLGGAIYSTASTYPVKISNCTFEGNYARCYAQVYGGGLAVQNSKSGSYVRNCTFYNNSINSTLPRAAGGSGMYFYNSTIEVSSNTVVDNTILSTSIAGGGIYVDTKAITMKNNLIAGNILPGGNTVPERADFYANLLITSTGYNLIQSTPDVASYSTVSSDVLGQNPNVLPLDNNGGITKTMGFDCTSPAFRSGDPSLVGSYSQNEVIRTSTPDIGAYQKHDMPNANIVTADVSCYGNSNGTASVSSGKGLSFSWSAGVGSNTAVGGLSAGDYTLSVTKGNCTSVLDFTINQPDSLDLSAVVSPDNGSSNGEIDLTVTGGNGGYSYSWDLPANTEDITGLANGTYEVIVTDSKNCTKTKSFDVDLVTSTQSINQESITVYPNPSNGIINISNANEVQNVEVIDYTGRSIFTGSVNQLSNNNLSSGKYILKITLLNGSISYPSIIVL